MNVFEAVSMTAVNTLAKGEIENLEDFQQLLTENQEIIDSGTKKTDLKILEMKVPEMKGSEMKVPDIKDSDTKMSDIKNLDFENDVEYVKGNNPEVKISEKPSKMLASIEKIEKTKKTKKTEKTEKMKTGKGIVFEDNYDIIPNTISVEVKETLECIKVERNIPLVTSTEDIIASRVGFTEKTVDLLMKQVSKPEDKPVKEIATEVTKLEAKDPILEFHDEVDMKLKEFEKTAKAEGEGKKVEDSTIGSIRLTEFEESTQRKVYQQAEVEHVVSQMKTHGKAPDELLVKNAVDLSNAETEVKVDRYFPGNKSIISEVRDLSTEAKAIPDETESAGKDTINVHRERKTMFIGTDWTRKTDGRILKTKDILAEMRSMVVENSDMSTEVKSMMTKGIEIKEKNIEQIELELPENNNSGNEKPLDFNSHLLNKMNTVVETDIITGEKQEISKASLVNQMSKSIETGMDGEKSFIRINLKPHLFGEMSIDLVKSPQGITARISAEKDVVNQLLSNSSREIAALFEDKNIKVENIIIEVKESREQQGNLEKGREGFNGNFSGGFNEGSRHGYKHENGGNGNKKSSNINLGKTEEMSQMASLDSVERRIYGEGINIIV
jgi:hypothetical protein